MTAQIVNPSGTATVPVTKPVSNVAPNPTLVSTPTGTISITLTPPPPTPTPLYENVSFWVALITLLGVIASLYSAHRRLKRELQASEDRMKAELSAAATQGAKDREHTRTQAALDREHSAALAHKERITVARRAVYTEAASELVKAQTFLGALASQNMASSDFSTAFGGLIAAVGKITILGEMETVLRGRALLAIIHKALFKCMAITMPLSSQQAIAEYNAEAYKNTQLELKRILAAMTNLNETNNTDAAAFAALGRSFDFQQKNAEKHRLAEAEAQEKLAQGRMEYMHSMLDEAKLITESLDALLCSVRDELGLATSAEQLAQSSAETLELAQTTVEDFMKKVAELSSSNSN